MGIYLKEFGTHAEYEKYIGGGQAVLPNVSVCGDETGVVHYNPEIASPYTAVDLGLSVKWADMNVGATKPEDYGDYFMWGSTTPDTDKTCDWANAPFNNGSSSYDAAYFASVSGDVCPNGILAPEYDAAHAIMGGSWRMPTSAEMQELIDRTTQTVEEVNGVKGVRFTSNAVGNTNSIFMPLAGYRENSGVFEEGRYCCVWSSSLDVVYADYSYYLYRTNKNSAVTDTYVRCQGYVVRGVC